MSVFEPDLTNKERERAISELCRAESLIGGAEETAKALGIASSTWYNWRSSGEVPALAAKELAKRTDVDRRAIRPDVYDREALESVPLERLLAELERRNIKYSIGG